jgi:hypothetical protein
MRQFIDLMESNVIKAPNEFESTDGPYMFLAGSIDMGKAIDWQAEVEKAFKEDGVTILNPRRDDWDSSWKQDISDPKFNEQVTWELDAQDAADIILMFFDPKGEAPITLMELGLYAEKKAGKMAVCCGEGFWRRGNVQIVCDRFNIPLVDTLEELIAEGKKLLG